MCSKTIHDLPSWKKQSEIVRLYGNVGGKLCSNLIVLGCTMSVPILNQAANVTIYSVIFIILRYWRLFILIKGDK